MIKSSMISVIEQNKDVSYKELVKILKNKGFNTNEDEVIQHFSLKIEEEEKRLLLNQLGYNAKIY
jgi:hypothetical protein